MNSRQLIDVGARVALAAGAWLESERPVPRQPLHEYWSASKCRLQRWMAAFQHLSAAWIVQHRHEPAVWAGLRPMLEEVLASEILSRTFAATAKASDELRREREVHPVAASVLTGHLEARNRVLHLISVGQKFAFAESTRLNDLRQKVERWCDMLLSHVALRTDVSSFAFDAGRCRDFADDLRASPADPEIARELILASLAQSFRYALGEEAPSADLNGQIAAGALACLGQPRPLPGDASADARWLDRLHQKADETQGLIEELLS